LSTFSVITTRRLVEVRARLALPAGGVAAN
jgi:hypothetical protein